MLMDIAYVAIGLVLLVLAGDALVRGSVNLSLRLGIPPLIVGLTVVAFGTSAPELLVSVSAILDGVPGIALGNVVGSNIANIFLVLGIPAIISTIHSSTLGVSRGFITMLAATALFIGLCFLGPITWWHAAVLLVGLALMLADNFHAARSHRNAAKEEDLEGADPSAPWWKIIGFLGIGLIGLPIGAELLVNGAANMARVFGISETVIGLTLVAVGTSLPELATSVIAALKKQSDVAMGNVIGSNVFNLLGIIGVAGFVGPIPVPASMLASDLWVMAAASLLLVPFILMRFDITRAVGIVFVAIYAAYTFSLVAL
ncbi:calcium/sodium antiporter [Pseudorhodobacter turbinis]|uniref:Calcium/sodium antiporter n=1 Tax=Pseudorhodobacter turbinis TaxID=2500533 RepID=A0A4P8EGT6_9RHOB|nr:calcium/sodium antiporter [Pseudorhodobacter turbinis]QCO56136.1 calcium/sodium antiporter [Pseudorhodobacter turbinis]